MFSFLFALVCCNADAGVGGFVKINFPYNGNKADLLSQLTVVVKTPQGSIVDEAEVQPTGYWIIPTPDHRELVISVRGPDGFIFSPAKQTINYPFNSDVDFQLLGFSILGKIATKTASGETVQVSAQLNVEVSDAKSNTRLTTSTNPDGTFSVGPVLQGEYKVQLKDAIAEPQTVTVTTGSATCDTILITDWPQNGKIVFPEGAKARSVKLQLTGASTQTVNTDEDGYFIMKNLNVGRYTLQCAEPGVSVTPLSFSVTTAELPTPLSTTFNGVKVAGTVQFPDGKAVEGVVVKLMPAGLTTKTGKEGKFEFTDVKPCQNPSIVCELPFTTFDVPAIGEITTFAPSEVAVKVVNARIQGFVECPSAEITVSGAISTSFTVTNRSFTLSAPFGKQVVIKAQSECGFETNEITVTSPAEKVTFQRIKSHVTGSVKCLNECENVVVSFSNMQNKYTLKTDANGVFDSNEIEFGTYSVSVSAPQNTVFEETKTTVQVNGKKIDAGEIAHQTAFKFVVTASHQMTVAAGKQTINLQRGTNTIQTVGTVVSPADCHIFEPIDLRTSTRIMVHSIEREIIIGGEKQEANYEVFVNSKPLAAPFKFTQGLEEKVTVKVEASSPFYVEPEQLEVTAPLDCSTCSLKFEIIRGKEYKGKIFPAIEGVLMTATVNGVVKATVTTSSTGEYTLGTHASNLPIVVTATKAGYSIRQRQNSLDFEAEKLATITATFSSASADGTLVSLTRSDGFKSTERVKGTSAVFSDLAPGDYTINPVKREYLFTPKLTTFAVKAGQDVETSFAVTRTRFGISGYVRSITGVPEPDVEVTAVHPDGEKTTDVTNEQGYFRLGNLVPNATYTIVAQATGTSAAGRVTPDSLKVELGEADSTDHNFLSIRPSHSVDILGEIDIDKALLSNVHIVLQRKNKQVVARYQFPSTASNIFFFTNLTQDDYVLTAASTRQGAMALKCTPVEIEKGVSAANVVIKCEGDVLQQVQHAQEEEEEREQSSLKATVFAMLAAFVWLSFFNFTAVKETIMPLFSKKK